MHNAEDNVQHGICCNTKDNAQICEVALPARLNAFVTQSKPKSNAVLLAYLGHFHVSGGSETSRCPPACYIISLESLIISWDSHVAELCFNLLLSNMLQQIQLSFAIATIFQHPDKMLCKIASRHLLYERAAEILIIDESQSIGASFCDPVLNIDSFVTVGRDF